MTIQSSPFQIPADPADTGVTVDIEVTMNTVALPTPAFPPALRAEPDLIRKAAGGDAESFGELYRRHSQSAWRLAQATTENADDAVQAVSEGFASVLRPRHGLRKTGGPESGFGSLLLAAVYRATAGHGHGHAPTPAPAEAPVSLKTTPVSRKTKGGQAKPADAVVFEAAFRSLPERWRGAVWLSEVEGLDAGSIAPILGVSIPVATQLTSRGRRGLEGRFAQARRPVPDHLGSALRPLADAVPAKLAAVVEARWLERDSGVDFGALGPWLSERAVRPLWAAVGGLTGLGLIGLGIVGPGAVVSSASGTAAGSSANALPVGSSTVPCFVNCPSNTASFSAGNGLVFLPGGGEGIGAGTNSSANPRMSGAGFRPSGSVGGSGSSPGSSTSPSSGSGSSGSSGSGSGSSGAGSSGSGGSGTQQQSKTVVDVPSVATVTQTGSTVKADVLPTSGGGSVASVTVGCSTLLGVTVGPISVGCPSTPTTTTPAKTNSTPTTTPTTTPPTTTTTLPLIGPILKLLNGL
jgi:DNA-directed RNA polymerase specialized sigma24 family protein